MAKVNQWARAGFDLKQMAELAVKYPIGAQVKYVGTRGVERHQGQRGIVVWYQDANGIVIQFEDGETGSATPDNVELLSPPSSMAAHEVSALVRFVADYLDKVSKPN